MKNPYIAVQQDANDPSIWRWRIECVEGYFPWNGPYPSERAAQRAGAKSLAAMLVRERRSELIAEGMGSAQKRHGRVR